MPHDLGGNEIKIGDKVTLTGTVTKIYPDAQTCNIEVEVNEAGKYTVNACSLEIVPSVKEDTKDNVVDAGTAKT